VRLPAPARKAQAFAVCTVPRPIPSSPIALSVILHASERRTSVSAWPPVAARKTQRGQAETAAPSSSPLLDRSQAITAIAAKPAPAVRSRGEAPRIRAFAGIFCRAGRGPVIAPLRE
jgi:hypothetical protein